MAIPERLFAALSDLAQTLVGEYDVSDILDRLCDRIVEVLDVNGAGVMLFDESEHPEGVLRTVAASDARIHAIERLQIELGEGPCLEAWLTGERVVEDDLLGAEERWPRFAPAAVKSGMRAVYSVPLRLSQHRIGALNLFCADSGSFGEDRVATAQLLADMATVYIVNNRAMGAQADLSEQLQRALDGRVVIEQAKGKIAGILDIDVDEAFHRLRSYARNHGLRLRAVASEVVDGTLDITAAGESRNPKAGDESRDPEAAE